jgi:hypothetical protein
MNQVGVNAKAIKAFNGSMNIALITNCDVPLVVAQLIDVIVPISSRDVLNTTRHQWVTRVNYNAYLPFRYSYITDTHVFPCKGTNALDILHLFAESDIDIAYASLNNKHHVSGGGILSRFSEKSFSYWKEVYLLQVKRGSLDDQTVQDSVIQGNKYRIKQLSLNWFFFFHPINSDGEFTFKSPKYLSSTLIDGAVRWVHSIPSLCTLLNGKHNEFISMPRVYLKMKNGEHKYPPKVVFSNKELAETVYPNKAASITWNRTMDSFYVPW